MISDEVFAESLDKALKAQKIPKSARVQIIGTALLAGKNLDRDALLESWESGARKMKKAIPSEAAEQKQLVKWLRDQGIIPVLVRNDGYRRQSEKAEQLLMGLCPGAADLYIPVLHCWVEMKRSDGGAGQSDKQEDFEAYVVDLCGDRYILANGFEDAKAKIALLL